MRYVFRKGCLLSRDERGLAALEFVLVAPILIFLVFGTMRVGYMFGVQNSLSQLASQAARIALPERDSARRESVVRTYVSRSAKDYAFLDARRVDVVFQEEDGRAIISVNMDVSQVPSVPFLAAIYEFPRVQTARAVIGVQE
ncbi:TadE/TadG family type IV pilus assembly protein [Aureimonas ureilytica]|uniref:TadE/TadG family type IV pilus assembly protein n=1 Tax=Aureimonas ureilytica TaxID=401562 RepID=UPI003CECA4BE